MAAIHFLNSSLEQKKFKKYKFGVFLIYTH
jgi:hypothetical protein